MSVKQNPPSTPLFLTDNIKMDKIPTKIKCKIVLIPDSPNSMSKFYLQIADINLQQRFFHHCSVKQGPLGRFAMLIWWLEPHAPVEKNRTSLLPCNFCRGVAWCTIFLEGNELNILYCFSICYFNVTKLYIFRETNNITVFGKFSRYWEQKLTGWHPAQKDWGAHATEVPY